MIATANSLFDGHGLLSDWLFLIAAALFLVAAVVAHPRSAPDVETTARPRRVLTATEVAYAGLCVAAVGFLVL